MGGSVGVARGCSARWNGEFAALQRQHLVACNTDVSVACARLARINRIDLSESGRRRIVKMAPAHQVTRPENMLPIMIVLGIMFVGICIAMNLFSR